MHKCFRLKALKRRDHLEDIDTDGTAISIRCKSVEWIHMVQGECTRT
jgi:hypothetical protein